MSSRRLILAIACGAFALAAPLVGGALAHGDEHDLAYGKPGDPRKPARSVEVLMKEAPGDYEMMFIPNRLTVRVGEQVRFVLRNVGNRDHEFVLGTVADNLAHMKEMEKAPRHGACRTECPPVEAQRDGRDRLAVYQTRHLRLFLSHSGPPRSWHVRNRHRRVVRKFDKAHRPAIATSVTRSPTHGLVKARQLRRSTRRSLAVSRGDCPALR